MCWNAKYLEKYYSMLTHLEENLFNAKYLVKIMFNAKILWNEWYNAKDNASWHLDQMLVESISILLPLEELRKICH